LQPQRPGGTEPEKVLLVQLGALYRHEAFYLSTETG
jgi:hypothetical protein